MGVHLAASRRHRGSCVLLMVIAGRGLDHCSSFCPRAPLAGTRNRPWENVRGIKHAKVSTVAMQILPEGGQSPCSIKVLGVGGGGSNAVKRMMESEIDGVDFWSLNTDVQALGRVYGARTMTIGNTITRGLGAGGVPEIGRRAADESRQQIADICVGTDLVFVTAGMGGGTGSGAAPVVAEVAKEAGALTVGVVTKPFSFEGRRRMAQANQAIAALEEAVDTLIVVNNDQLLKIIPADTPVEHAFKVADDVLRQGVVGISDIIVKPGLINVDFADVRSVMGGAGTAMMGIGRGSGKNRAEESAHAAISSALLDVPITGAQGIVFNVLGGKDMTLQEINAAAEVIYANVDPNANIIFGALVDETMGETMAVTVIATGFGGGRNAPGTRAEAQNIQIQPKGLAVNRSPPSQSAPSSSSYGSDKSITTNKNSNNVRKTAASRAPAASSRGATPVGRGSAGGAVTDAQRAAWAPRGFDDVSPDAGSTASSSGQPEYGSWPEYDGGEAGGRQPGYSGDGYGAAPGGQRGAGGGVDQFGRSYGNAGGYPPQGRPPQGQPIPDSQGYYPGEMGYRADTVVAPQGQGPPGQGQGEGQQPYMNGDETLVSDGYGGLVRRQNLPPPPAVKLVKKTGVRAFFRRLFGRESPPKR